MCSGAIPLIDIARVVWALSETSTWESSGGTEQTHISVQNWAKSPSRYSFFEKAQPPWGDWPVSSYQFKGGSSWTYAPLCAI